MSNEFRRVDAIGRRIHFPIVNIPLIAARQMELRVQIHAIVADLAGGDA